jgi:hypothetical protein
MDSRRRDLRLTWDEVAAHAGIHRETLRQIRIGSGDIRPLSAAGIENALEWERGSIDAILEGRDPTTITEAADGQLLERDHQDPAVAKLAERLERQEKTTARLSEENAALRRMLREITGKDSASSGSLAAEPDTEAPRQAI